MNRVVSTKACQDLLGSIADKKPADQRLFLDTWLRLGVEAYVREFGVEATAKALSNLKAEAHNMQKPEEAVIEE